jgi:hypothetical protein
MSPWENVFIIYKFDVQYYWKYCSYYDNIVPPSHKIQHNLLKKNKPHNNKGVIDNPSDVFG